MLQRSVIKADTWIVRQYTRAACATVIITIEIEPVIIVSKSIILQSMVLCHGKFDLNNVWEKMCISKA